MNILHVFDPHDNMSARYAAMLTEATPESEATMRTAVTEQEFESVVRELKPDIVHQHAQPTFPIPAGYRLVLTPHGNTVAQYTKAYAIIARSPMEAEQLQAVFKNVVTVRNPLITRTTTPMACANEMLAVYKKVMRSNVLPLMSSTARRALALCLAADICGDRRWITEEYTDQTIASLTTKDIEHLFIYTDCEGVAERLRHGMEILGMTPPPYTPQPMFMPDRYKPPIPMPTATTTEIIGDINSNGPSMLRLMELAQRMHSDSLDEQTLMQHADQNALRPLLASLMQLMKEQLLLTEGFMPCPPANNRDTKRLRQMLEKRFEI